MIDGLSQAAQAQELASSAAQRILNSIKHSLKYGILDDHGPSLFPKMPPISRLLTATSRLQQ